MSNTLFVAVAGAGKTTQFVKEALKCKNSVLITTFTEENEEEIREKFRQLNNGIIPSNVTIKTWFSLLIEHGAKPYQGKLTEKKITGLVLVNKPSGVKYISRKTNRPVTYKETEVDGHYFTKDYKIYSDKLAKFVVNCDKSSGGAVITRISKIFENIFIDEVQDLAGYDLELIKLFLKSSSTIKIAGDPRQVTYHTHFSPKFKKYKDGLVQNFIENECKKLNCIIDTDTLKGSWRNNQSICDFANKLFPDLQKAVSLQASKTSHDGIFLVREKDVDTYLETYLPTQLRIDKRKQVNLNYEVKNFGKSKGLTRDRVLIYPTIKMWNWITKGEELDTFETRCKFYVAITRARYSVAIVCPDNFNGEDYNIYQP